MKKYRLDIALERAVIGAVLAFLPCVKDRLASGVFEIDWRNCLALALSGFIGGLLVDFAVYKTEVRK